jgi:FixJ family two-component response regulator
MNEHPGQVMVVDDDDSVRRSLDRLLRSHGYAVETYPSGEAFLADAAPVPPACAILDLAMPGLSGLELQQRVLDRDLACGIVFLTGHGDLETGIEAMRQGAVDFLSKPIDEVRLLDAVSESLAEQRKLLEEAETMSAARSRLQALTPRERDVMKLVVAGRLNKLIAADLHISEKTVKAHRANVMRKAGVRSVADLVRLYIASGVADEQ